jgi:hypothetical protein
MADTNTNANTNNPIVVIDGMDGLVPMHSQTFTKGSQGFRSDRDAQVVDKDGSVYFVYCTLAKAGSVPKSAPAKTATAKAAKAVAITA